MSIIQDVLMFRYVNKLTIISFYFYNFCLVAKIECQWCKDFEVNDIFQQWTCILQNPAILVDKLTE